MDTASWAPAWIGYVFSPWLAAAWLAGATFPGARQRAGALRGITVVGATVLGYLIVADGDAPRLLVPLTGLALAAGPLMGLGGATWRMASGRAIGAAALGAVLVGEGLLLQLGARTGLERAAFAAEVVIGLGLAWWLGRRIGAP